jgi:hypothetical protein
MSKDKSFKEINDAEFEKFKGRGGLEYMQAAFSSLLRFDSTETAALFFDEIVDSLKTHGPFGAMNLLKALQEIVGGTGYPINVSTHERFGKVSTRIELPQFDNFAIACLNRGTSSMEEIEQGLKENLSEEDAKHIYERIKAKCKL